MKKFISGLVLGFILATTTFVFAANPIKLIINGKEIKTDAPPQMISGRVFVPARFVAEPLGAQVEWDAAKNAVVVQSSQNVVQDPATPADSDNNNSVNENLIHANELVKSYGAKISITNNYEYLKIEKDNILINVPYDGIQSGNEIVVPVTKSGDKVGEISVRLIKSSLYFNRQILNYLK